MGAYCLLLVVFVALTGSVRQDTAFRVHRAAVTLDDLLETNHPEWQRATAVVWGAAPYPTEFRALFTDEGLAVRFAATDDSPWHTLAAHDDHLWNEEVVEIFIDPDGDGRNYAELEINPANVVCDLQIFTTAPELQSDIGWHFDGLRSAVQPFTGDDAAGWTAVAVLPWADFGRLRDTDVRLPPATGDRWKFNVFRIKRPGGPQAPERGAIYAPWSPTPTLSFHAPSAFRKLVFDDGP